MVTFPLLAAKTGVAIAANNTIKRNAFFILISMELRRLEMR